MKVRKLLSLQISKTTQDFQDNSVAKTSKIGLMLQTAITSCPNSTEFTDVTSIDCFGGCQRFPATILLSFRFSNSS